MKNREKSEKFSDLNLDDYKVSSISGSVSLQELFGGNVKIDKFEVFEKVSDLRFGFTGKSGYDSDVGESSISEDQAVNAIRIKGYLLISYGKRRFDVIIDCYGDISMNLPEEVYLINSKINRLADYFRLKFNEEKSLNN